VSPFELSLVVVPSGPFGVTLEQESLSMLKLPVVIDAAGFSFFFGVQNRRPVGRVMPDSGVLEGFMFVTGMKSSPSMTEIIKKYLC